MAGEGGGRGKGREREAVDPCLVMWNGRGGVEKQSGSQMHVDELGTRRETLVDRVEKNGITGKVEAKTACRWS